MRLMGLAVILGVGLTLALWGPHHVSADDEPNCDPERGLVDGSCLTRPEPADSCQNPATQLEMNACADIRSEEADRELEVVYARILAQSDESRRQLLQKAQQAWVSFRDVNCYVYYDSTRAKDLPLHRHDGLRPPARRAGLMRDDVLALLADDDSHCMVHSGSHSPPQAPRARRRPGRAGPPLDLALRFRGLEGPPKLDMGRFID